MNNDFSKCIASYIATHRLLDAGEPVLVTLSGGADSVALLRVLVSLGYSCHAAHCNFHLRGEESDRDEQFVANLCHKLRVPLSIKHMDVAQYQVQYRVSIEMACRELRYAWFNELAAQLHCQAIAVAHHADDNIETFFLNALRGTGIAGLAAMKPRNGNVVRPMLCATRAQVEQYLQELGQDYVVDSTNLENDYQRNKIRNVIVPAIEGEFSSARKTLAATVEHVRDYALLYQDLIDNVASRILTVENGVARISIAELLAVKTQQPALLLCDLVKDYAVSHELCQNIINIIAQGEQNGQHFYTSIYTLSLTNQHIVIEQTNAVDDDELCVQFHTLDSIKVKLEIVHANGIAFAPKMCDGKTVVAFSSEILNCSKVVLRHWREGDRMRPFGMRGTKLLSDLFTDLKLTPEARKAVWLLEADGKIVWVLGHRAGDLYRVAPASTHYILLKYHR